MTLDCYVVDDDEAERQQFQDIVAKSNCQVTVFSSGPALLEHLSRQEKDKRAIVLTDIMMEPMDGFSLCTEIRKRGFLNVEVMFMTRFDNALPQCEEYFVLDAFRKDDLTERDFETATSRAFRPKVVFLDDDEHDCNEFRNRLEALGMTVFRESSPRRFLNAIKTKYCIFDCYVLDVELNDPDLTGVDVCTEVRAMETNALVCLVSGLPPDSIARRLDCTNNGEVSSIIRGALTARLSPPQGICILTTTKDGLRRELDAWSALGAIVSR